jgi:hypothetical protein
MARSVNRRLTTPVLTNYYGVHQKCEALNWVFFQFFFMPRSRGANVMNLSGSIP